jgi:hypothetical protein
MKVFLINKAPIPLEPPPICIYRLHIKSMSGDADAYNTEILDFKFDLEQPFVPTDLIIHIKLFMAFFELEWNQGCDEDLVAEGIILRGRELDILYPIDTYCELVGNDVTCEGIWAKADEMWVTFFDHDGVEHNVEIWIDEKKHDKITRQ